MHTLEHTIICGAVAFIEQRCTRQKHFAAQKKLVAKALHGWLSNCLVSAPFHHVVGWCGSIIKLCGAFLGYWKASIPVLHLIREHNSVCCSQPRICKSSIFIFFVLIELHHWSYPQGTSSRCKPTPMILLLQALR